MGLPRLAALIVAIVSAPLVADAQQTGAQQAGAEREALPKILRPSTPPKPRTTNPGERVLVGTGSEAFVTIQGSALSSSNRMLTDATVRLRDARFGRIVDVTTTDKAGMFIFRRVNPGTYVAELVDRDGGVLGASELLNANAGETLSAVVKMPFRIPVAGVLGNSAPAAALITATAAASGVLATRVTATDVSPRR
jgi:hypothetical protein